MSYVIAFLIGAVASAVDKLGLDKTFKQLPIGKQAITATLVGALVCGSVLALLLPLIAGPPNLGEMARQGAMIGAAGGAILGLLLAISPLGLVFAIGGAFVALRLSPKSPAIIVAAALFGLVIGILGQFYWQDGLNLGEELLTRLRWQDLQNKIRIAIAIIIVVFALFFILFRPGISSIIQQQIEPPSEQQLNAVRRQILARDQGQWEIGNMYWDSKGQHVALSVNIPSSDISRVAGYCNDLERITQEHLEEYKVLIVITAQGLIRFHSCS